MARYGTFKYGAELYGEDENTNLLWGVLVDWDGDGSYAHNESFKMQGMSIRRGRTQYIRDGGIGIENMSVGTCSIKLVNYDGRYTTYNTSSPLYPNIVPGKKVKVFVKNGYSGSTYDLFRGELDNVSSINLNTVTTLTVKDGINNLMEDSPKSDMLTSVTSDEPIADILTSVNYPTEWGTSLSTGANTLNYFWTTGNRNAYQEIADVVNSEIGTFFVANDGTFTFRTRQHAYVSALTLNESDASVNIIIPLEWSFRRSILDVLVASREQQSVGDIWNYDEVVSIDAGETLNPIWAEYVYDSVAVGGNNVLDPVSGTDYTANTDSGGGGSDITSDISIVTTKYGGTAKLVVTNNGVSNGYITLLKLRGNAITKTDPVHVIEEGVDSTTNSKRLVIDYKWLDSTNTAQDFADFFIDYLSGNRPFPIVEVANRPTVQFGVDIDDIITLVAETIGINAVFKIGGIEHVLDNDNGSSVTTKFYLEPYAETGNYWTWPTKIGETAIFGW